MNDIKYRVIFKGEIADGETIDEVKKKLAAIFKTDAAKIDKMFTGGPKVVKKDAPLETCEKAKQAFEKAGAICTIEPMEVPGTVEPEDTTQETPEIKPPPLPVRDKDEMETGSPDADRRIKRADETFCKSCGEIIQKSAEVCPKCGVRQKEGVNKVALVLLTFFLGGLGAHKFYLKKYWQGVLYFIFSWTLIPGLIAFIEFIIYAFTSEEKLREKYTASGSIAIIIIAVGASFMFFIAIIGILAAIAIPNFVTYRDRAFQAAVISELKNVQLVQEDYFSQHNRYAENLRDLDYTPSTPQVTVHILSADGDCFEATGKHENLRDLVYIDCRGLRKPVR